MDFKHKKIRKTNNTINNNVGPPQSLFKKPKNNIGKKEPSKIVFALIVSYLVFISLYK